VRKEKAADRGTIPIPSANDDNVDVSDQDLDVLAEFGGAVNFLHKLDHNGIMRYSFLSSSVWCIFFKVFHRSKKETQRLHDLTKPIRKTEVHDDLPSFDLVDEDSWDSNIDDDDMSSLDDEDSLGDMSDASDDSNEEMSYETIPRKQATVAKSPDEVKRLPIKLANGKIQETGIKPITSRPPRSEDESEDSTEFEPEEIPQKVEDVSTGARFGRPAVVDVLQTKSRKHRIEMAKEQIAGICQDILADPENGVSLGFLKPRIHFLLTSNCQ